VERVLVEYQGVTKREPGYPWFAELRRNRFSLLAWRRNAQRQVRPAHDFQRRQFVGHAFDRHPDVEALRLSDLGHIGIEVPGQEKLAPGKTSEKRAL
jgi:hypothetical protein